MGMMVKSLFAGMAFACLAAGQAQAGWVPAHNGSVVFGAEVSGMEANGAPLFVCRARFNGGLHPGKMRHSFRGCNIGWGGREHTLGAYDLVISNGGRLRWLPAAGGQVFQGAMVGGREANGQVLYVCRAFFNGGTHIGKVRAGFRGCNIGWGGREHTVPAYQLLMAN